jgi:hypothetical protein
MSATHTAPSPAADARSVSKLEAIEPAEAAAADDLHAEADADVGRRLDLRT